MTRKTRRMSWLRKLFHRGAGLPVGFTGPAFTGASGVPIEDRIGADTSVELQRGGRSRPHRPSRLSTLRGGRSRFQRGGHRPFGFEFDNSLGKVYSSVGQIGGRVGRWRSRKMKGGCGCNMMHGGRRSLKMRGGNNSATLHGITSTTAGFSMNKPFIGDSATFMEHTSYPTN
jgi:hypothetical protein